MGDEGRARQAGGNRSRSRSGARPLAQYAARWLDSRRVRSHPLAPKTRDLYRVLMRVHLEPTFGKRNLNAISAEAVRRWHASVSTASGAMTAAKSYRLLRAMLSTAVADGLIQSNPCRVHGAGRRAITGTAYRRPRAGARASRRYR